MSETETESDHKLYIGPKISDTLINALTRQKGKERLDLTEYKLNRIPLEAIDAHFGTPACVDLDLSFNVICYIRPDFVFQMKQLVRLDLSRNEISKLPENFGELENLIYLDLHRNQLQTLPLSMGSMTRLTYLSVAENPLRGPLKQLASNVAGLKMAEAIISYLREISLVANVQSGVGLGRQSSTKVQYTPRSKSVLTPIQSQTESEGSPGGGGKESLDVNLNRIVDKKSGIKIESIPKELSSKPQPPTQILIKFVLLVVLWFLLMPIFIACVVDVSYLTDLAKISPTFDMIWTDYNYKQWHESAQTLIQIIPRNPTWIFTMKSPTTASKSGVLSYIGRFFS